MTILSEDSGNPCKNEPFGSHINAFVDSDVSCKPLFAFMTPFTMERESELEIAFTQEDKQKMCIQDNSLLAINHKDVESSKGTT